MRTLTVRNFNSNNIYTPSEEEKSKIEDLIKIIPEKHKAKKSMNLKRVKSPVNKIEQAMKITNGKKISKYS